MEFEFVDQLALMPTGRDMLLAGSVLGTEGDPALMEFLKGQSGGLDYETGLVGLSLFGTDAVFAAGAVALMEESGECGCSGKATHHGDGAELQIIETPGDEFDPALDPQFGYVDVGGGAGYDDANGNGQYDQGETVYVNGRQTEDRLSPTVDLWGSGSGGGGGSGTGSGDGGVTEEDDKCGQDDVPPWTNPDQPTRNTRANDAITITVDGNNVTISGTIAFIGAGADANTASRYLESINSAWTGNFSGYLVTTRMTIGSGGIVANIDASPFGGQWAELGGTNMWAPSLTGGTTGSADYNAGKFAHEFGHILGLMDMYDTINGARAPGYGSNIMGNEHALPDWQNIRDLLAQLNKSCS